MHRPHEGVFCRLAPSQIHGVGVFAILPIPKGTLLFSYDGEGLDAYVDDAVVQESVPAIKKLYTDFCISESIPGKWGCPRNFDNLTVGWYVNHSKEPNIDIAQDWNYTALRDIAVGEEVTADYDTYSPLIP